MRTFTSQTEELWEGNPGREGKGREGGKKGRREGKITYKQGGGQKRKRLFPKGKKQRAPGGGCARAGAERVRGMKDSPPQTTVAL